MQQPFNITISRHNFHVITSFGESSRAKNCGSKAVTVVLADIYNITIYINLKATNSNILKQEAGYRNSYLFFQQTTNAFLEQMIRHRGIYSA